VNTQCILTPPKLFGSLKTDVSLLAVSISPTDARYASPFNAVQFLKTAGLRIWNSIVVTTIREASTREAPLAPVTGQSLRIPTEDTLPRRKASINRTLASIKPG